MCSKKSPDRYVLEEDCVKQHTRLELALFGQNGRAGMVKDVSDIKAFIGIQTKRNEEEAQDKKVKRESLLRYKLVIVGFAFTLVGFIAQYLLSKC
jgi:hypothetical protein